MISFVVPLTTKNWSADQNGWRCPPLRITGLKVAGLYNRGRVSEQAYSVDATNELVHWQSEEERPKRVALSVTVPEQESQLWKRIHGIAVPIATALIGAFGAALLGHGTIAADGECELWTVVGRVKLDHGLQSPDIFVDSDPPRLAVDGQGKFQWDVPVLLGSNDKRTFPMISLGVQGDKAQAFAPPPPILLGQPGDEQFVDEHNHTIRLNEIAFEPPPPSDRIRQSPTPVRVK